MARKPISDRKCQGVESSFVGEPSGDFDIALDENKSPRTVELFTNTVGNAVNIKDMKRAVFRRGSPLFLSTKAYFSGDKGGSLENQNWFYSKWKSVRMALRASAILVAYVLLTVFSVVVIYGLSAGLGHIDPVLPFFSDIGDQPVESTLFTQCFVVDAAFLAFLVQIRFVYAAEMLVRKDLRKAQPANRAGLYVGYTAASGLFVVACFQESHVYFAHYVALLLYLAGSVAYFGIQAALSKSLDSLATTRMILASFMCGFFLSYCAGYVVAMKQLRKPWEERHHWKEDDGGWTSHLVSAASEWILMLLFQAYALTFYKEFRSVMLTKTRIIVVSE